MKAHKPILWHFLTPLATAYMQALWHFYTMDHHSYSWPLQIMLYILLMFHHCWLAHTCERQCGAVHTHHTITGLTHIAAIVWCLKAINNKCWNSRHSTAGAPYADVGRVVDKSHFVLCPGDGCGCWVCCAVQPDHRLLPNVVYSTTALEEDIWEGSDCQLGCGMEIDKSLRTCTLL